MTDYVARPKAALDAALASTSCEVERARAELGFAETLCELHPGPARAWRPLIARACGAVERAAAQGGLEQVRAAVREAEGLLVPLGETAKTYTIYCVGHAHIDMNWTWSWPETVAVTHDTFATVLRLMDEFPEFHFSQSQASVYAIIERYRPDYLKRIAARVREGRWEVTASHWVEPDKNLVGGEALCRHLLYTRRYLRKLFRLTPEDVQIDWSPDSFGHAVTVPTYLVRGGVRWSYLHRPGTHGPVRPGAFWWQGPDGSRVLVRNDMQAGYNGVIEPGFVRHLTGFARATGLRFVMFVYGVGDHGGGPTRRDILRALDMNGWPIFPQVRLAAARTFFQRLEREGARLPVLDCELNTEFTGCYTSQALIKQANRLSENRLVDAEAAAALAWALFGQPYRGADFVEGWRDTLFSHFHDILPGSGVRDTRTYTHGLFQKTMALTSMAETRALRRLAAEVATGPAAPGPAPGGPVSRRPAALGAGVGFDAAQNMVTQAEQTRGDGPRPFVVFNPTAWDREEIVEATLWENTLGRTHRDLRNTAFAARSPEGETVQAQVIETGHYCGHEFARAAFPARAPGLGYALYTVVEGTARTQPGVAQVGRAHHCHYSRYERSPEGLENDLVRLELDPATGGIRELRDRAAGVSLIRTPGLAATLEYAVEQPGSMTAWHVNHTGPAELPQVTAIERKLSGPYRASLDVRVRIHESEFVVTYELRARDPRLYVRIAGTWFERGTPQTGVPVLRLALPLALTNPKTRYEIPFGALERDLPHGEEVPALQWAHVSGRAGRTPAGLLLINDSKHGHALDGSTLRLNLIRSSYDRDPLPEIGPHDIRVALCSFAPGRPVAAAIRMGREFNHPLRVVGTDVHAGRLPATAALVSVGPASVILSAFKKAEDEAALVLRFFDPTGRRTVARARLNAAWLGRPVKAVEVDLLERPVPKSSAKLAGDTVSVIVPARGIASVMVRLKARRAK